MKKITQFKILLLAVLMCGMGVQTTEAKCAWVILLNGDDVTTSDSQTFSYELTQSKTGYTTTWKKIIRTTVPDVGVELSDATGNSTTVKCTCNSEAWQIISKSVLVNVTTSYEANNYTVKFDANRGSGSMDNESFTYDIEKALTSNAFCRTGYTFLGWSEDAGAATATYTDGQSVSNLTATNNATVTLYAVWQANATVNGEVITPSSDVTFSDDLPLVVNSPITVASVSYSRVAKNQWGTLVLPFAITVNRETQFHDFYKLSSVSGNTLNVTRYNDGEIIPANTPVLIRRNAADAGFTISQTGSIELAQTVGVTPKAEEVNGFTLTGVYTAYTFDEEKDEDKGSYFIYNNAFYKVEDCVDKNATEESTKFKTMTVNPYRAYLAGSSTSAKGVLELSFDPSAVESMEVDAESLENAKYYDLSGRETQRLVEGINIVKFKNGKTKKIVVR